MKEALLSGVLLEIRSFIMEAAAEGGETAPDVAKDDCNDDAMMLLVPTELLVVMVTQTR